MFPIIIGESELQLRAAHAAAVADADNLRSILAAAVEEAEHANGCDGEGHCSCWKSAAEAESLGWEPWSSLPTA